MKSFALKLWQCGRKTRTESINCLKYFSINRFRKSLRIQTLVLQNVWKRVSCISLWPALHSSFKYCFQLKNVHKHESIKCLMVLFWNRKFNFVFNNQPLSSSYFQKKGSGQISITDKVMAFVAATGEWVNPFIPLDICNNIVWSDITFE